MKCTQCGEEMELQEMPCELFTIPFTNGRFCIWDWGHKDWQCRECNMISENRRRDEIYNSIADSVGQEAYQQGFKDGQMET